MRLEGRAAIITGAASGIGRASAQFFAAEGANVLAVDRPEFKLAAAHAGQERISPLEQDVTMAQAPAAIIEAAIERFGRLYILFKQRRCLAAGTGR